MWTPPLSSDLFRFTAATISRDTNGGFAAQVDLFDIQGNQRFDDIPGDPHDLQITPDERRELG